MIGTRCDKCGEDFPLEREMVDLQIDIDSPLSVMVAECPNCGARLTFQIATTIAAWLAWAGVHTSERIPLRDIRKYLMTLNNEQAFQAELRELLGEDEQ